MATINGIKKEYLDAFGDKEIVSFRYSNNQIHVKFKDGTELTTEAFAGDPGDPGDQGPQGPPGDRGLLGEHGDANVNVISSSIWLPTDQAEGDIEITSDLGEWWTFYGDGAGWKNYPWNTARGSRAYVFDDSVTNIRTEATLLTATFVQEEGRHYELRAHGTIKMHSVMPGGYGYLKICKDSNALVETTSQAAVRIMNQYDSTPVLVMATHNTIDEGNSEVNFKLRGMGLGVTLDFESLALSVHDVGPAENVPQPINL